MDSELIQQVISQLTTSQKVLIALPKALHPDSLGSALALGSFLRKLEKEVEIVSSGDIPKELTFLPAIDQVKKGISLEKSLVVVLNTTKSALEELSYQTAPGKVNIFLKPKAGSFVPEDITLQTERAPYSAIVILDASSLEDLGELFENHADLFYETPKINIDHHPTNQHFGTLNLVDITATSTAEVLMSLFEKYEKQLIDQDIATQLLVGIISKTDSFQHVHTTPQAFLKASELINLGGRQQEIIKHLYKTKSLSFLRLWGRALARLKINSELSLVYSLLNQADFEKAESSGQDLPEVLKELTQNIQNYRVVALLAQEQESQITVSTALHQQFDSSRFFAAATNERKTTALSAAFNLVSVKLANISLQQAEELLLEAVKSLPGIEKV